MLLFTFVYKHNIFFSSSDEQKIVCNHLFINFVHCFSTKSCL